MSRVRAGAAMLIAFLAAILPYATYGQAVELTPFAGYTFGGKISVRDGDARIVNQASFGGIASVRVAYGLDLELQYLQEPTKLEFTDRETRETRTVFDLGVHHYQLGALYEVQEGWSVPFFGFSLGAANYLPSDDEYESEWRFAFTFSGGAKLFFNEHLGLRLQGQLLFPLQWSGGSFFCGAGDCDGNVSSTTSIVQANLSAGIIFHIGRGRTGVR